MSSYLLFCVAQVPKPTIDSLLLAPRHNFFSLVRDPSQENFDPDCTQPPVTPFDTGFSGYISEQIRDFINERLPPVLPRGFLKPNQYALLDDRSANDQTVILAHSYSSLHDRDSTSMTESELEQWERECDEQSEAIDDSWLELRVPFVDAERLHTVLSFEQDFTAKLHNQDFVRANTNSQSVFQLGQVFQAFKDSDKENWTSQPASDGFGEITTV